MSLQVQQARVIIKLLSFVLSLFILLPDSDYCDSKTIRSCSPASVGNIKDGSEHQYSLILSNHSFIVVNVISFDLRCLSLACSAREGRRRSIISYTSQFF